VGISGCSFALPAPRCDPSNGDLVSARLRHVTRATSLDIQLEIHLIIWSDCLNVHCVCALLRTATVATRLIMVRMPSTPPGGALATVLRISLVTTQKRLLRTTGTMFATGRMSANSMQRCVSAEAATLRECLHLAWFPVHWLPPYLSYRRELVFLDQRCVFSLLSHHDPALLIAIPRSTPISSASHPFPPHQVVSVASSRTTSFACWLVSRGLR